MEQIVALGMASGNLKYCLLKEIWHMLPYGIPLVIKSPKGQNKTL